MARDALTEPGVEEFELRPGYGRSPEPRAQTQAHIKAAADKVQKQVTHADPEIAGLAHDALHDLTLATFAVRRAKREQHENRLSPVSALASAGPRPGV